MPASNLQAYKCFRKRTSKNSTLSQILSLGVMVRKKNFDALIGYFKKRGKKKKEKKRRVLSVTRLTLYVNFSKIYSQNKTKTGDRRKEIKKYNIHRGSSQFQLSFSIMDTKSVLVKQKNVHLS